MLGVSQYKLSQMLRGQFRGINEAKMFECLTLLGRDVQIVIGPARRSAGRMAVVFAATALAWANDQYDDWEYSRMDQGKTDYIGFATVVK